MYLSKVFKGPESEELRPVPHEALRELALLQPEGFKAVALGAREPEPDESPEEEELPPPPPMILEEEALARIAEAREEGMREGKRQAEMELSSVAEALAQSLLQTQALRERVLCESEEDLLLLAVAIARKVVLAEISLHPEILARVVRGAVEALSEGDQVVVRLSRDDYRQAADCPEFAQLLQEKRRISLKADPALPPGGCLVETERGNIDAGLESQLDEILRRLLEQKNARRAEEAEGA